ncbi:hypothetical protein ES708_30361 [subsurface metagenome]
MKDLIKRIGLIFIVAGVVLLGVSELGGMESNKILIISGSLILGGFIVYVILNNIME